MIGQELVVIAVSIGGGFVAGALGAIATRRLFRTTTADMPAPQLPPRPTCRHPSSLECTAYTSPDCSDGRCRYHCKIHCTCETDKPPVDALTAEAQRALGLRQP